MYVYFIKTETTPALIKIGKSNNVEARLAQLQTGSFSSLSLCHTINCKSEQEAFELERTLHDMFKEVRINGEWFKFTGNMKGFIAGCISQNKDNAVKHLQRYKNKVAKGAFDHKTKNKTLKKAHKSVPAPTTGYLGGRWVYSATQNFNREEMVSMLGQLLGTPTPSKKLIKKVAGNLGVYGTVPHLMFFLGEEALARDILPK